MRGWLGLVAVGVIAATTASAQDTRLKSLENVSNAGAWQAVGRLDIGSRGFCTGALIGPDLVLTAAHCLFDKTTGARIEHETIEFLAGLLFFSFRARSTLQKSFPLKQRHVPEKAIKLVSSATRAIVQKRHPCRTSVPF